MVVMRFSDCWLLLLLPDKLLIKYNFSLKAPPTSFPLKVSLINKEKCKKENGGELELLQSEEAEKQIYRHEQSGAVTVEKKDPGAGKN